MKNIFIALSLFVFSFSALAEDFVCKTEAYVADPKGTDPAVITQGVYSFDYNRSTDVLTKIDGKKDDFAVPTFAVGKDDKGITIRVGHKGKMAYWFGFNGRAIDSVIMAEYKTMITRDSFKGDTMAKTVYLKMYSDCSY